MESSRLTRIFPICTVAFLILGGNVCFSAGIVNGNFNSGLTGWSGGPSLGTNPFPSSGRAGFSEIDDGFTAAILFQTFALPASAQYVSWEWEVASAAGGTDNKFGIDTFSALVINSSNVVTSVLNIDEFGLFASSPEAEVFGNPFLDGVSLARFDVSALAGQSISLQFEFLGFLDGYESTGYIDNAVVPVPGAFLLGVIGLGAVRSIRKRLV